MPDIFKPYPLKYSEMKAKNLEEVIEFFDSQKALTPANAKEWESFYTETNRNEVEKIITEFCHKPKGHKILFGGHSGNGKSTELNRLIERPKIKDNFSVIMFDVKEVLNPNDIEIVELLLTICLNLLEFASTKSISSSPHIESEFKKIEGFFRQTLKIESVKTNSTTTDVGAGIEGSIGAKIPFLGLISKFYAKMSAQHDSRKIVREEYRPRLTEIIDLIHDLIIHIGNDPKIKPILIIIDGLDRVPLSVAKKLFVEDGQNIAMIKHASMLITVPISIIHSIESALVAGIIGNIKPLANIHIKSKDDKPDETNMKILNDCVLNRMDKELITDNALKLAIEFSGGVFRTLVELISDAAVNSKTLGGDKIDDESMEDAIRELKIVKSRPLTKKHLDLLLEIYDNKTFLSEMDNEKLELLHGLFVLEYINGDEWYDINPLLQDRLKDYKKHVTQEG
ncbi:MAG: hypothetical protein ACUZ8E_05580 [Candidatus Anammoxibacter sp.]